MKIYLLQIAVAIAFLLLIPLKISAQDPAPSVQPVSLQQALERAPKEEKKILVDVYASWCPYCRRMHSEIYPSESVQKAISDYFLWVKIDVESDELVSYHGEEMTQAEFARALENKNVPTVYFLNDKGSILGTQPGFLNEDVFVNLLNFVGSDAYLNQSFKEFTGDE